MVNHEREVEVRIVIVGGGVIGTAHALAAVDRGHAVVQLARSAEPRGASVRIFGLVWICGLAVGRELELALAGRAGREGDVVLVTCGRAIELGDPEGLAGARVDVVRLQLLTATRASSNITVGDTHTADEPGVLRPRGSARGAARADTGSMARTRTGPRRTAPGGHLLGM